jgi:hypothetical protein
MDEKIMMEDEGSTALWKHVAELEEANMRLKASNAETQQTIDGSIEAVCLRCLQA